MVLNTGPLDWESSALTTRPLLKLSPWKLEPWFILLSLFLLGLLCIFINLPYSLAWNIVTMSGLMLLAGIWKCWISYKNAYAWLLVLHLMPHRQNVNSLSLFYCYYFDRCSSELAQLVPLLYSWRRSTSYSNRLNDFSVTIPRCYKDVYVNSFFPRTARLWYSLPIECFPLT